MKRLHIFKAGKHVDSDGNEIVFSQADIAELAASYDPKVHEAPIVVGHPKDNAPAFGWAQKLEAQGDDLFAIPHQVNKDFDEMVEVGAFKKISASIYLKDSPTNPTPGKLHLRHIGFLGAQPPAIKGLTAVQFSADTGGVSTFEESYQHEHGMIAKLFRGLRDYLIGDKGLETADKVVPAWAVEELERSVTARQMAPTASATPSYSEHDDMDAKELKAAQDKLAADQEALKQSQAKLTADQTSFAERDSALAAREVALAQKDVAEFCDGLVKEGRLLPAQVPATVAALLALPATGEVSFAEGDKTVKASPRDAMKSALKAAPKAVSFKEHDDGASPQDIKGVDFAEKIKTHRTAEALKGRVISFAQAAAEVQKTAA